MRSEVYNQSICLMNEVVYYYYLQKNTMVEISEKLGISKSTVSRLLKRAEEENVISFQMAPDPLECIHLEQTISDRFNLDTVLVTPVNLTTGPVSPDTIKKQVALEGARYLQRIITDDDIIGFTWGGTMYHLIQYLNPCRRKGAKIITLHGSIANCNPKFAVDTLVKRAAMAFGGKNISLCRNGLLDTREMAQLVKSDYHSQIQHIFNHIDIAISGVGALYPDITTPLATTDYLTPSELKELTDQGAYCDLLLRFIDRNGQECNTSMKDRTYSIDIETYKKIPKKVIVASGREKASSLLALINGKLLNVLIIDQILAKALLSWSNTALA